MHIKPCSLSTHSRNSHYMHITSLSPPLSSPSHSLSLSHTHAHSPFLPPTLLPSVFLAQVCAEMAEYC